jgi:hypothetical protein
MTVSVRPRAVVMAVIGVIPLTLLVQWSDVVVGGTMTAGPVPPLGACMLWGLLLLGNRIWGTRGRPMPYNRSELILILAAWVAANMVAGRGLVHPLLATLTGPTYYARGGAITRAVGTYIPNWLAVTNKAAARDFYEGHGVSTPWTDWRRPLCTWALFLLPFLLANVCLCALFERVWVREERLAYPLVALPMEVLDGTARATPPGFRTVFLFGLAFPLLLHGLGVTHAYLPAVPAIPFYNDVSDLLTTSPWTAARPLYFNLYPLLIGLSFLAPTDITLSVWFFLLLNKIEMVVTAAMGWDDAVSGGSRSSIPFLEEQSAGAYLMLAGLLVWSARHHLRRIGTAMFARNPTQIGSKEVDIEAAAEVEAHTDIPETPEARDYGEYRALAWGFWAGVVGLLAWSFRTGMPLWFAVCFFGFYLVVALVLGRLMAEGGVSWILAPILPDKLILSLLGTAAVSPLVITRLMLQVQLLRDTRQMLAPAVFEAGKLRDTVGYPLRRFYALLLAVTVLAVVVGVAVALPLFYAHGALSLAPINDGLMMSTNVIPMTGVNQATERLSHPMQPSAGSGLAVIFGVVATWGLAVLRRRFLWWPLHPLGYALTGTMQLGYANKMLVSVFLGWLFKALTLRFGGARGFRLLRGAALGLVLGDLMMGCMLKLLDALLGPSGYALF